MIKHIISLNNNNPKFGRSSKHKWHILKKKRMIITISISHNFQGKPRPVKTNFLNSYPCSRTPGLANEEGWRGSLKFAKSLKWSHIINQWTDLRHCLQIFYVFLTAEYVGASTSFLQFRKAESPSRTIHLDTTMEHCDPDWSCGFTACW